MGGGGFIFHVPIVICHFGPGADEGLLGHIEWKMTNDK